MNDGILLVPHLGMGDAIILNGMVRVLAQSHPVTFPCKHHNLPSVRWMFSDLHNVNVVGVAGDEEMLAGAKEWSPKNKLHIGMFSAGWMGDNPANFDEQMYNQAGQNFECSWSHFKVPDKKWDIDNPAVSVFLCDDPARGYRINERRVCSGPITRPHFADTLFRWIPYVRSSGEIHCIDSSFMCLIDRLQAIPGQKLFWHRYARRHEDRRLHPTLRRQWKILE